MRNDVYSYVADTQLRSQSEWNTRKMVEIWAGLV